MEGTRTGNEKLARQLEKTHQCETHPKPSIMSGYSIKFCDFGDGEERKPRWLLETYRSKHGRVDVETGSGWAGATPIKFCPFCGIEL